MPAGVEGREGKEAAVGTPSLCPPSHQPRELRRGQDSQQVQSHGGPAALVTLGLSPPPPSETGTTVVLILEQRERVFPTCRVVHARKCKWTSLPDRLIDAITVINAGAGPAPQDRSLSHIPLTSPADPQVGPGPLGAVLSPPGPSPRETSPAPPLLRRWAPSHCLLITVRVFWLRRAGRAS